MGLVWSGRDAGAPTPTKDPEGGMGERPSRGASHPPRLRPNQATWQHDSRYRGWLEIALKPKGLEIGRCRSNCFFVRGLRACPIHKLVVYTTSFAHRFRKHPMSLLVGGGESLSQSRVTCRNSRSCSVRNSQILNSEMT